MQQIVYQTYFWENVEKLMRIFYEIFKFQKYIKRILYTFKTLIFAILTNFVKILTSHFIFTQTTRYMDLHSIFLFKFLPSTTYPRASTLNNIFEFFDESMKKKTNTIFLCLYIFQKSQNNFFFLYYKMSIQMYGKYFTFLQIIIFSYTKKQNGFLRKFDLLKNLRGDFSVDFKNH